MSLSFLALAAVLATVTGSGVKHTEARAIESFSSIDSGGAWNLEVVAGDKRALEITGDDNVVPLIETKVKGGVLVITAKERNLDTKTPVTVKITTPALDGLTLKGAGQALVKDVSTSALELNVSGAGNLTWKGPADSVTLKSTGAGSVVLVGNAKKLDAVLSGAGNVDASAFEVKTAKVRVSGAGNANVNATEALDAEASGAGVVAYAGQPKLTQKVSGAGAIKPVGASTTRAARTGAAAEKPAARGGW